MRTSFAALDGVCRALCLMDTELLWGVHLLPPARIESRNVLLFSTAELPADRKHNAAMARPQRATTTPGAIWSTSGSWRSRHVHVWDGLCPEAALPPSRSGSPRRRSHFATLPYQRKCKDLTGVSPHGDLKWRCSAWGWCWFFIYSFSDLLHLNSVCSTRFDPFLDW